MNNYRRARNNNKIAKSIKDYIIPTIIWIFVILILFNIFSSWDDTKETKNTKTNISQNNDSILVTFKDPTTKAIVIDSNKKETNLKDKSNIELWKEIVIKEWIINLNQKWNFSATLNKPWKLIITKNTDKDSDFDKFFNLKTWDLFLIPEKKEKIITNYATISLNEDSIVSVSQNDVQTSVYVLAWVVNVETKAKKSTSVPKNKKISIELSDAKDENIDLNSKIEDISTSFLEEKWCSINNCSKILEESGAKKTKEENKKIPKKINDLDKKSKNLIKISWIEDQEQVFDDKLNIKWKILKNNISKITFNNKETTLDEDLWTFYLKWLQLNWEINDIVWKVFNDEWDIIGRWVYTVYFNWKLDNKWFVTTNNKPKVENYPIDYENKFKIISPKTNPFNTTADNVRIEWAVPAWLVQKIQVNNFTLTKFKPGWTYWNFFANAKYGYLKDGINNYEIKYFGKDWKMLYRHTFTINKTK